MTDTGDQVTTTLNLGQKLSAGGMTLEEAAAALSDQLAEFWDTIVPVTTKTDFNESFTFDDKKPEWIEGLQVPPVFENLNLSNVPIGETTIGVLRDLCLPPDSRMKLRWWPDRQPSIDQIPQATCIHGADKCFSTFATIGSLRNALYGFQQMCDKDVEHRLTYLFPALNASVGRPCECGGLDIVRQTVVHLNDEHQWTREQIADWVEEVERTTTLNFKMQPASVGD